jgi:hypothetical protein
MDSPTPAKTTSFAHQAATLSWVCPIIVGVLARFGNQLNAPLLVGLVVFTFLIVGLILGVVALFGISKHGKKGILWPALIGIVLNGFLLFIFVTNFIAARDRAMEQP